MKLGEKIVAAEERLEDFRAQVADIVKSAEDAGRDLLEEEVDQIEGIEGELESTEKSLKGLKSAEKALSRRAEARTNEKGFNTVVGSMPARAGIQEKPGALLSKAATVAVLAHIKKMNPLDVINERYAGDSRVAPIYDYIASKAATTVATTTAAGWAAELVNDDLTGFIADLEAVSVYGAMAMGGTSIPFGMSNSVSMPGRSGNGNVSGSFVGENATIPVKADNYSTVTFNRYKLACITTFSNELARTSTPQIEALLRDAIRQDTGESLDNVVLDPTKDVVSTVRPASPWFGAATQASAGNDQASVDADLRFLTETLSAANAGRSPRIIMNPARLSGLMMMANATGSYIYRDEVSQGRIMGIPLIVSTNCPADHVFIIDLADFGSAFGTPEYDVSDQATLVLANDDGVAPTMADTNAVSVAGSLKVSDAAGTTPPTVVSSMFQQWSVALRMVLPISFGMMRAGTAAYLTGVSW